MHLLRRRLYVLAPLFLILSITATIFVYGLRVTEEANEILATAFHLTTTDNRPEDFAAIRQQYGRRLRALDGCASDCTYKVGVNNLLLSKLHLVPYTELIEWFQVRDGRVLFTMLEYRTALKGTESPVVHVQTDFCGDKVCGWMYLNPWSDSSELRSNGMVEVGYAANVQRRQQAYAMSVRCLYTIGGCRDIAALLPSVWLRTDSGNVSCRIPNNSGAFDWCKEALQVTSQDSCP